MNDRQFFRENKGDALNAEIIWYLIGKVATFRGSAPNVRNV